MGSQAKRLLRSFTSREAAQEVRLRIYEQGRDLVLERETLLGAGTDEQMSFTQMYAGTPDEIAHTIANDPDEHLSMRGAEYLSSPLYTPRDTSQTASPSPDLLTLAGVTSDAALIRFVMQTVRPLGATGFFAIYVHVDPQTRQPLTHVALAAGDNGFLNVYVARRWFAIDPFLIHGRASNTPMYSSHVGLLENLTGGWYDMGVEARRHGLCSWAGFPTHRPGTSDFGLLYIASPTLPADGGEHPFQENARQLRGLAAEIFDWQLDARKVQRLADRNFSARDLQVLKAVADGATAHDIAAVLQTSERDMLKRIFPEIVAKAGTKHIRDAARRASELGLLPTLNGRKLVHIAVSDVFGVYLGSLHHAPFWSKMNPSGIRDAFAFSTEIEARELLGALGMRADYRLVRVEIEQSADTVSEALCVAAGVPAWNRGNALHSGAPADDSATPGALTGSST